MTSLKELTLDNSTPPPEAFKYLQGLTRLENLSLRGTAINDAAVRHLREMSNLRILNLSDTPISDAALEHIKTLVSLKSLHISGTAITLEGLDGLQTLPALEYLELPRTVAEDEVPHLGMLKNLRSVTVWESYTRTDVTGLFGEPVVEWHQKTVMIPAPDKRIGHNP
jgi:hypothetical protein